MNRLDLINLAALLAALCTLVVTVGRGEQAPAALSRDHARSQPQRIISASLVGDALLAELCEPERIVAYSRWRTGPGAYKLGNKPRIDQDDIEAIIALRPDLVVVSSVGESQKLARLRELDMPIADLGPSDGLASFLRNAERVGELIGSRERGERFAQSFARRMETVAARLPAQAHRFSALYLAPISGQLFGGTVGTSYHDVLTAAGLIDAAQDRFRDWPQFSLEQVIAIDPEVIVTKRGMAHELRALPGFSSLRACTRPGGLVEIDEALLEDAGPLMLDAAEAVYDAVYGAGAGTAQPKP
jgi:iron complex transport system substrate-binding protein